MFQISKHLYDRIILHAREAYPNECCGILAGRNGSPSHIYQVKNVDPSPTIRYLMDTQEQFWVFKNMRHNQLDLIAIYHSHPKTEAYPSRTDVSLAFYPDACYLLVSLMNPQSPAFRAFRIVDKKIMEEPVAIQPGLS